MTHIAILAGVFMLLVWPPKSDRLKGRGQTKLQSFFVLTSLFLSFISSDCFLVRIYLTYFFALLGRKAFSLTPCNYDLKLQCPYTLSFLNLVA